MMQNVVTTSLAISLPSCKCQVRMVRHEPPRQKLSHPGVDEVHLSLESVSWRIFPD
jgi:hypothetical protein